MVHYFGGSKILPLSRVLTAVTRNVANVMVSGDTARYRSVPAISWVNNGIGSPKSCYVM